MPILEFQVTSDFHTSIEGGQDFRPVVVLAI
jgi:hypothetical protein